MINLNFTIDNISTITQIYNRIYIERATQRDGTFTTVSGLGPIVLINGVSQYTATDLTGVASDWYRSQYYSTTTNFESSWSDPILGESGDLYYNPLFPPEISYGSEDQAIINRIRRLIGDPLGLRREYGDEAASSIHSDGKVYEMDEKGWPVSINMSNRTYNTTDNPNVNGYKYLKFSNDISVTTTISGVEYGVDVWSYTFRFSDREIMEAYDTCATPPGLTSSSVTSEAYMLQTAIDLLMEENFEDAIEDGANIQDEGSKYSPEPGFNFRDKLMARLQKRLDELVKQLILSGITGVRID